jgi:hypothetical protein
MIVVIVIVKRVEIQHIALQYLWTTCSVSFQQPALDSHSQLRSRRRNTHVGMVDPFCRKRGGTSIDHDGNLLLKTNT